MCSPVQQWFGNHFSDLDPLIQSLHTDGGNLNGKVTLDFGKGLAGIIGRRLASKNRTTSCIRRKTFKS
jgi:hypothetical protein